jgi:hypothetical protein
MYMSDDITKVERRKPRFPEHEPGLKRALKLIEHVRLVNSGDGVNVTPHPAMLWTLDRLKTAIEAELENGGPLTTEVGLWR